MGFFRNLFGYRKVEQVLDDAYFDQQYPVIGTTSPYKIPPPAREEEYVEEVVAIRVKPRKPKKLNRGLTKKVTATKPKKKATK